MQITKQLVELSENVYLFASTTLVLNHRKRYLSANIFRHFTRMSKFGLER